eukprot:CAMPEP_0174288678 /NCGR_PEP_ID=MMETSP0809-20121228/21868_1 /TAXON_ID=73025 ORGANISM="Eutreptiella gymnastica-like, Strain CCMP1594" /NCGR_SAMPLE_ID=MMETSP0809 /ASSEMBLY_ACC=CAM_ASM_000658 /LENGTH=46 /DNA_ID= /DNA_START= /DNA_END= /DNA_ORIENTATION=
MRGFQRPINGAPLDGVSGQRAPSLTLPSMQLKAPCTTLRWSLDSAL